MGMMKIPTDASIKLKNGNTVRQTAAVETP